MEKKKETIIISLNVFKTGELIGIDNIISIGCCIGMKQTGEIIETSIYNFICKNIDIEFYNNYQLVIDRNQLYATNNYIGIVKFLNMILEYEEIYIIEYICDLNDLLWINYYMSIYLPIQKKRQINNTNIIVDINTFIYCIQQTKKDNYYLNYLSNNKNIELQENNKLIDSEERSILLLKYYNSIRFSI
jgi:hypothetical protein